MTDASSRSEAPSEPPEAERPEAPGAFWNWSRAAMTIPSVRGAALRLQDAHTLNANLALWCLWCARAGHALTDEAVAEVARHVHGMDRYAVRRLREVRRYLSSPRPGFSPGGLARLRREVYEAELAGERLIQLRMEADTLALATRAAPGDQAEAARRLFTLCRRDLETPVLLADDRGPFGPDALFGTMIDDALGTAAAGGATKAEAPG